MLTPTKRYVAVGHCIYCGCDKTRLSDEHIIPYGIGGRLLLPAASCPSCARETSRCESKVLNQFWGTLRTRVRFPLRGSKKHRRGRIEVVLGTVDNPGRRVCIPAVDYPASITFPVFPPPKMLLGRWNEAPQFVTICPKEQVEKLGKKYGTGRGPIMHWHAVTFFRMLAKIGYSFAVAEAGIDQIASFNSPLPRFIRYGAEDPPTHLIGGAMKLLPKSNILHQLSLWTGFNEQSRTQTLVATVRFFSHYGSPVYQVVIGRRPFTSNWVGQAVLLPTLAHSA